MLVKTREAAAPNGSTRRAGTQRASLQTEIDRLAEAIQEGQLGVRVDVGALRAKEQLAGEALNTILETFEGAFADVSNVLDRLEEGDAQARITNEHRGGFNAVKTSVNGLGEQINLLAGEMEKMAEAAKQGDLDYRGDTSKLNGDWSEIVAGANRTLENVVVPMRDIGGVLDRLSAGDAKAQVVKEYDGDYNVLKVAANSLGEQINIVTNEMEKLAEAAKRGDLDYRGDTSRLSGDIAEIVAGANRTLENVVVPMRDIGGVLDRLASGETTARVENDYDGDYDVLKVAANGLGKTVNLVAETVQHLASAANQLSASSEELSAVSQQMSANADQTSNQSGIVSAAAEQINSNIGVVATSAEELSSSIREVSKNTTEAAQVGTKAVGMAKEATTIVDQLGQSSAEIGQVIKVITSIAQQTNLLALNATIEAASAGEAGKGFAVVANEVKELAKETARATEDISRRIESIQGDSTNAVQSIEGIAGIINQINDFQNVIASSVEEQSATTSEISKNVNEAVQGVSDIAENTTSVAQAAESTASGAGNALTSAQELAKMADNLQKIVSQFSHLRC